MDRYIVREGSNSAHCCFEASVLDTTLPSDLNQAGHEEYQDDFEAVCECFEPEKAQLIADCLNSAWEGSYCLRD